MRIKTNARSVKLRKTVFCNLRYFFCIYFRFSFSFSFHGRDSNSHHRKNLTKRCFSFLKQPLFDRQDVLSVLVLIGHLVHGLFDYEDSESAYLAFLGGKRYVGVFLF